MSGETKIKTFKAWEDVNGSYTVGKRFSGAIFDLVED